MKAASMLFAHSDCDVVGQHSLASRPLELPPPDSHLLQTLVVDEEELAEGSAFPT